MSSKIAMIAPILVLLIIAAAAAAVYFLVYRRRINRSLQQDGESGAGPEPANVTRTGFIVVLIIALILMFLRIGGLSSQITVMNNTLQRQYDDIRALERSIEELKESINKANSAVSAADFEIKGFNEKDNTAEVLFKVIPAEAKADTDVSVAAGSKTTALLRTETGTYEGTLKADIFGSYPGVVRALITTDGVTVSEELNFTLDGLWVQYLPQLISDGGGQTDVSGGKIKISWDANVYFQNSDCASFDLSSARLVEEIDGKVTSEEDLSSKLIKNQGLDSCNIKVDKKVSYTGGSYRLYVSAKDSKGYTHKVMIVSVEGMNGMPTEVSPEDQIFDASGKRLTTQFKY